MNKITEATSQKIKNMSLLCALLVVAIHVGWPHDTPLTIGWFIHEAVSEGIARIAVPFFFVVSGFFLAQHFDEEGWYVREVKKRVRSLVVPYVCWSLIAFAATASLSIVLDAVAHRPFGTRLAWMQGYGWLNILGLRLSDPPILGPLWYVRCLLFFVLTSFVFKRGVMSCKYAWLAGTFLLTLFDCHVTDRTLRRFLIWGYSTSGVFYFSVGIFIQRFKPKAGTTRAAVLCGAVGIALLAARLCFVCHGWQGAPELGKLSLPFLLYATWCAIPATRLPVWLTSLSFPIFLIHNIILKKGDLTSLPLALAIYTYSIIGSAAIALLLRRFTPRLSRILFGGR